MTKLGLCDYNDAYIPVKRTITVTNTGTTEAPNNRNKRNISKLCSIS